MLFIAALSTAEQHSTAQRRVEQTGWGYLSSRDTGTPRRPFSSPEKGGCHTLISYHSVSHLAGAKHGWMWRLKWGKEVGKDGTRWLLSLHAQRHSGHADWNEMRRGKAEVERGRSRVWTCACRSAPYLPKLCFQTHTDTKPVCGWV